MLALHADYHTCKRSMLSARHKAAQALKRHDLAETKAMLIIARGWQELIDRLYSTKQPRGRQ
jgi:hypothetical protein